MEGKAKPLVKILGGADTRFVIPVYQRNYDWKREQCNRLFSDLEDISYKNQHAHFFGSIVSKGEGDHRVLIDGQQRITTSFILLAAMLRQIADGNLLAQKPDTLAKYIQNEWLIDEYEETEKLKLKLVKDDQEAFKKVIEHALAAPKDKSASNEDSIVNNEESLIEGSNVTENYRFFLDKIEQAELSGEQLREAIKRLIIIDITLDAGDDAQLIFESLNSTGLELSEGDKIRNFILMNMPDYKQEDCYKNYWNPIEKNTDYDVSKFVRFYLSAITRKTPTLNRVYPTFKRYADKWDKEELLKELKRFSIYWEKIRLGTTGDPQVDTVLKRLALLDSDVLMPFLLNSLATYSAGDITSDDLAKALEVIETYVFRRWVCDAPTNALNKIFETLHWDAMRGVSDGATYADALTYSLLSKRDSSRLPRDDEFKRSYRERNFYKIGNKRFYLFERLENGNSVERMDVVSLLQDGDASIEHIMPRTLNRSWHQSLGPRAEIIHGRWLNSMGNLTLTGYNSKYSNKPFAEKRDCSNGFKESGFRLNKYVASCDTWGEKEIQERSQLLWERFIELWPLPQSGYLPQTEIREAYSLDDAQELTGRKPSAFVFQDVRHPVDSWVDVMKGLLPELFAIDPVVMLQIAEGDGFPGRFFSTKPLDYGFNVGGTIWFNPGSATKTKCDILATIIERISSVELCDLSFEIRPE